MLFRKNNIHLRFSQFIPFRSKFILAVKRKIVWKSICENVFCWSFVISSIPSIYISARVKTVLFAQSLFFVKQWGRFDACIGEIITRKYRKTLSNLGSNFVIRQVPIRKKSYYFSFFVFPFKYYTVFTSLESNYRCSNLVNAAPFDSNNVASHNTKILYLSSW